MESFSRSWCACPFGQRGDRNIEARQSKHLSGDKLFYEVSLLILRSAVRLCGNGTRQRYHVPLWRSGAAAVLGEHNEAE